MFCLFIFYQLYYYIYTIRTSSTVPMYLCIVYCVYVCVCQQQQLPPPPTTNYFNYLWHLGYKSVVDERPKETGNPCVPAPCGPNSKCVDIRGSPACSCLPDYLGRPPNCRPECMTSPDCPANLACVNQRCANPCIGACGIHSQCTVIKHNPNCQCEPGYTGDPFSGCAIIQQSIKQTDIIRLTA